MSFARADHQTRIYQLTMTPDGGRELRTVPIESIAARAEALTDARETQARLAREMDKRAAIDEAIRQERERRALEDAQAALASHASLRFGGVLKGMLRAARAIPALVAQEVRRG